MHPSKKELRQFVEGGLQGSDQHAFISAHVCNCAFCSEICDEYKLYQDILDSVRSKPAVTADGLAEEQYQKAIAGIVIDLKPFMRANSGRELPMLLAADGEGEFSPPVVNIATFFSDNPEVVLRVMRDTEEKRDYLQLVSADPSLVSNVLVRIPEQDKEFLTDSSGKAEITGIPTEDLEELGWQIKMPDAAFSLETLAYDPDSVEYRREIVLETEQNDRIRVSFEGKTEGKQIAISILELDGKTEFDSVRVILSQNDIAETRSITPSQIATFNLSDKVNTIKIRLFN